MGIKHRARKLRAIRAYEDEGGLFSELSVAMLGSKLVTQAATLAATKEVELAKVAEELETVLAPFLKAKPKQPAGTREQIVQLLQQMEEDDESEGDSTPLAIALQSNRDVMRLIVQESELRAAVNLCKLLTRTLDPKCTYNLSIDELRYLNF